MLPDRIFYPLVALVALGLIALAMVTPQGEGRSSPAPFGHPVHHAAMTAAPSLPGAG